MRFSVAFVLAFDVAVLQVRGVDQGEALDVVENRPLLVYDHEAYQVLVSVVLVETMIELWIY